MLDSETKRRIDTARDILVGKLPDPKSQVEQITIALIYKFMDDMDKESEELGGKARFFTGEYSKYSWSKIFDVRISGFEMFGLYSEAITRMSQNPKIPQLFRDIFKNAYLPYRDPETLKSFLKVINDFHYDHSEKLGDAFEYLLSAMGSQGEAGQFRTPRHIIDFMVKVVDPDKNETILDPACGSAGFLISAYKHILSKYKDKNGRIKLTPDERKRLVENFMGYDISPDMVRLSLVNLYLHGFQNPHIYEYDTLTSEERWNEVYDVIIANPPFMTPKGGIRPHKRFSIQANRSEVLFVDYIAEHLNPNGRAGIIVPEGIIFQSATAYKALRKMLIEHSLYAVVSLPAGVFNPYSGVKTSILLMDKNLVKKSGKILFVKITNDGFGLGAQRREVKENDLPLAFEIIQKFQNCTREGKKCELSVLEKRYALILDKKEINNDYNLSADRYIKAVVYSGNWPFLELGDMCEFSNGLWTGKKPPFEKVKVIRNTNFTKEGKLNLNDVAELEVETKQFSNRKLKFGDIILEKSGGGPTQPVGRVVLFNLNEGNYSFSNFTSLIRIKEDTPLLPFFLWACLNYLYQRGDTENLQKQTSGIRNLDFNAYKKMKIPLPPLEVQEQIVSELESYQNIVDGAKKVVESYKPSFKIEKEWEIMELGEVCEKVLSGGTPSTEVKEYWDGGIPWITSADIINLKEAKVRKFITNDAIQNSATNLIPKKSIIVVTRVGLGKLFMNLFDVCISQDSQGLILNQKKVLPEFVLYYLSKEVQKFKNNSRGSTIQGVTKSQLIEIKIPLPSLEIQKQIVAQIEEEQKLVDSNKKLIEIFEKKIKDKIVEVWGEKE